MFTPYEDLEISNGIYSTSLDGLYFVASKKFDDNRGYYAELTRIPELDEVRNKKFNVVQVNLARSNKNVVRGIHSEDWNKLVTITNGVAFCAFVDMRPDSPTFGAVETVTLGVGKEALHGSFFIPKGIGNSLCVTEGPVDYLYYVDALYKDRDRSFDRAVSLFDPDLAINWPLPKDKMVISERDSNATTVRAIFPEKYA
ncbi:MAG: dTDP-4-dehydrorhamnose 3,5-epimerase family protein [Pseudomonadales bacterium]|nr:dTDP-4-dehydrorhamnose 3,5-epimerase family protein [Pseudomonadales bacterium]